jgi:hypothetical protein
MGCKSLVLQWLAVNTLLGNDLFWNSWPSRYQNAEEMEEALAVFRKSGRRPVAALSTQTMMRRSVPPD